MLLKAFLGFLQALEVPSLFVTETPRMFISPKTHRIRVVNHLPPFSEFFNGTRRLGTLVVA